MTASVEYLGDLRTKMTHHLSGEIIYTDAPPDNQGKGNYFSPTDLLSSALATCMITLMGIKANQHQWDLTGTRAEVEKIMLSSPRRVGKIVIRLFIPGKALAESEKMILVNTAKSCPVALSLHPDVEKQLEIFWE